MKLNSLLLVSILLTGCVTQQEWTEPPAPDTWETTAPSVTTNELSAWWTTFNDPALTEFVEMALTNSPVQQIAVARIEEARGLRRTSKASLLPHIGMRGQTGREREATYASTGDFYTAGFDATFELDLFGKNRNTLQAAAAQLRALEAQSQQVEITLAGDVARAYIDYRAATKQQTLAEKNLQSQEATLQLVEQQCNLGETPQLDVERSETLVNTTRASIPEFKRRAENARLQLAVLTGQRPQAVSLPVTDCNCIPGADLSPLMLAPAEVLANRPDIRNAAALLEAQTALTKATIAELFPTISLTGFFGLAEGVLFDSARVWNGAIDGAVTLIDFGRIEGEIDASQAREKQAYANYRLTVLQAIADVETAMVDQKRISEQRVSLQKAHNNSVAALKLSEELYREGEISFLDVLDAQRTVHSSDSSLATAEAAQAQSIVRLYKSLGIY